MVGTLIFILIVAFFMYYWFVILNLFPEPGEKGYENKKAFSLALIPFYLPFKFVIINIKKLIKSSLAKYEALTD